MSAALRTPVGARLEHALMRSLASHEVSGSAGNFLPFVVRARLMRVVLEGVVRGLAMFGSSLNPSLNNYNRHLETST